MRQTVGHHNEDRGKHHQEYENHKVAPSKPPLTNGKRTSKTQDFRNITLPFTRFAEMSRRCILGHRYAQFRSRPGSD